MCIFSEKFEKAATPRGLCRVWEMRNEGGAARLVARWIDAGRNKARNEDNEEESRDREAARPIWVGMTFRFEWRGIADQLEVQNRKESGM